VGEKKWRLRKEIRDCPVAFLNSPSHETPKNAKGNRAKQKQPTTEGEKKRRKKTPRFFVMSQ
jgi:hypothetical protein